MKKQKLDRAVQAHIDTTRDALQTVYDALNQGQKKKILKNDDVKRIFDVYGVIYK